MLPIDEHTLTLLLQTKGIRQIDLRPAGRGYGVFVCMNRADEGPTEAMLITARMKHQQEKQPRSFPSSDSCLEFLKAKAAELPPIKIHV